MKTVIKTMLAMIVSVYSAICQSAVVFVRPIVIVPPIVTQHQQQTVAQPETLPVLGFVVLTVCLLCILIAICILFWEHYNKQD